MQDVLTVTITGSIIVNCIQAVSVFGKLSIDWIEPMDTFADMSNLFTFRVSLVVPASGLESAAKVQACLWLSCVCFACQIRSQRPPKLISQRYSYDMPFNEGGFVQGRV